MAVASEVLFATRGIELADKLSIDYIDYSIDNIESIKLTTREGGMRPIINVDEDQFA